jgi:hypothetical protein
LIYHKKIISGVSIPIKQLFFLAKFIYSISIDSIGRPDKVVKIVGGLRYISYIKNIMIKVMNPDTLTHHFARLEMMMAEERGIELSYEEAIKIVQAK